MSNEVHCIVYGKVQRVAYRDFAQRMAREFGIFGWVRNKKDGTVEVLAQGPNDALKDFVEALQEGSVLAHVESISADWRTAAEHFDDFVVIFEQ